MKVPSARRISSRLQYPCLINSRRPVAVASLLSFDTFLRFSIDKIQSLGKLIMYAIKPFAFHDNLGSCIYVGVCLSPCLTNTFI